MGLVWLVDKFVPSKLKPVLIVSLWVLIAFLGYQTFMSVYKPIQFNEVKNERFAQVIERLIDIRDAQLAHRQVTGVFAPGFDELIKFIDTAQYTITQRRDTLVLDKKMTKRYGGVETKKDSTIIDTLNFVPVRDSLFRSSTRYKEMMIIPVGKEGAKFEMNAGFLETNDVKIPVFEAFANKDIILHDLDKDLRVQENQVISVDGVNGNAIRVGSMNEVNTTGNWPKTYGDND
ncbi:hypothetical protein BZARG_2656 [Bizionia argentinensis JUB59]|uniref:Uncharacterized protein n=1 Tax=Bizionia argentinensis JUB59 TaxID=1046627 RepID=G2EHP3_9FLAO|nr:hypothetical protein BZARG_2656 [Bizionia argentinensis JUB59]